MRKILFLIVTLAMLAALAIPFAAPAGAVSDPSYDMLYPGTDVVIQKTINGAIWESLPSNLPTGSGVFKSFFRVGASPTERGYNTDGRPLQFDEVTSATFTHSVALADVPQLLVGGVLYREFQVDINEASSTGHISLDEFQVWTTNDPDILDYVEGTPVNGSGNGYFPDGTGLGQAKLVYNLDGDGNTWIKMDYAWNTGSGKRDYRVLVPESDFAGKMLTYCVIFTRHGLQCVLTSTPEWCSDDGYEEWGVAVYPATKSGYKFNDLNSNGVWDAGEPGLNGWTINLTGTDATGHAVSMSTVTANDPDGNPGFYSFSVPPGTYTVSEVLQAGWIQSCPAAPGTYTVTLGNGQLDTGNNFGNYQRGCLTIHKTVVIPACVVGTPPNVDFVVHVVGPSYPSGTDLTFHLVGGSISNNDQTLSPILPGAYTVTEPTQPTNWSLTSITPAQPVTVNPGTNTCATVTVTDTYQTGCLTIHKTAVIPACVVGTPPNVDFVVHVVGPSYPSGTDLTFHLVGGSISNNDQTLSCILPGAYTVTEPTQPTNWSLTSITPAQPITVGSGTSCPTVTVTDTYQTGCLTIHKTAVIPACVVGTPPNVDFVVHVVGPSYPSGTDLTFHLVGGSISNNDQTLSCLLPGAYTVTEPTQPTNWSLTSITPAQPITVGTGACPTVTVTDTFQPGCLTIHKTVAPAAVTPPNVDFVVHVVGPSYPSGTDLTFHLVGGSISNNDQTLSCILPGAYTVTEPTQPAGWYLLSITPAQPITVGSGTSCPTVTVTDIMPNTTVTIDSNISKVSAGGKVTLTVTEKNTGNVPLTSVHVNLSGDLSDILNSSTSGWSSDGNLDDVLDVGETWSWSFDVTVTTPPLNVCATGYGTDPQGHVITYSPGPPEVYPGEHACKTVTTLHPSTMVTIISDVYETSPGGNAILTVTEKNDSAEADAYLTNVYVVLTRSDDALWSVTLNKVSDGNPQWSWSSDGNNDDILDVGETWTWTYQVTVTVEPTTFTATGHGTDYSGVDRTVTNDADEQQSVTIHIVGATRTPGFWKTHTDFTEYIFETYLGSEINLGCKYDIMNMQDLMGMFWASPAKNSDGSKRSALCQAKEQLAFQALAAILNDATPGGATMPVTLAQIQSAMCSTDSSKANIQAIKDLAKVLDAYNNQGDNIAFDPSLPATGKATPGDASSMANLPFADCP
jgi:hypothetical protein